MIIDIIIVALVILGALIGYKKGLITILASLLGIIVAIVLAFLLQNTVADMLKETGLGNTLKTNITVGIQNSVNNIKEDNKSNKSTFYDSIVNGIMDENQINTLADNMTTFILKGISFIAIFIMVIIIVFILKNILNLVFDLPILNSINNIGGLLLGGVKSVIMIEIVLAIIAIFSPIKGLDNVNKYIRESNITNTLYTHNMFVSMIKPNIK